MVVPSPHTAPSFLEAEPTRMICIVSGPGSMIADAVMRMKASTG